MSPARIWGFSRLCGVKNIYLSLHLFREAATAGKLAKDSRHRDVAEEAGCDFIPLVVETFGIWSPFALCALHQIADQTTARSGASAKVAWRNLLQQLSVSLWTSNARMVLRYWALQDGDNDFPVLNSYSCCFVFVR